MRRRWTIRTTRSRTTGTCARRSTIRMRRSRRAGTTTRMASGSLRRSTTRRTRACGARSSSRTRSSWRVSTGSTTLAPWAVNAGSIFDNIFVTDSLEAAWEHADAHWAKISEGEKEAQDAWDKENAPAPPEDAGASDLDDEDGLDEEDL